MRHAHSDRLERWLGPEAVASVSRAMRDFYYPIPLHGVPGHVYAMPGGDFTGEIRAGQEMSAVDRAADYLRRERRRAVTHAGHLKRQAGAFGSLDALIAAATGGKKQELWFQKVGVTAVATQAMSLFRVGNMPPAGAAAAAAPGGTAPTSATTGALPYFNAVTNADTHHFVAAYATAAVIGNTLLLFDRIFAVAKAMNSTATEAVTGAPTRYQNQVAGADDYIGGNFCTVECGTVLPATAHSWTVCQYTDQAGNTANNFTASAGISACAAGGIDLSGNAGWFLPLAAGDSGVKKLTQMQCSALVATGAIDFVLGHPIAFFPCPIANLICPVDGVYTALNLTKVFDNACLTFLEMPKPTTTATTYSGQVTLVSE